MEREIIIKRLAIIKQLFLQGVEQSNRTEGISSFSILSFHDSVEMFLKLYSEYKNVEDCFSFPKYWDKFPELPHKEQMNSLTLRRKNLKHKGVFPSKLDIEHSKFSTREFLQEASVLIDSIQFDKISLTDLVYSERVRILLKTAESEIENKNYEKILECVASAFKILITIYEDKATGDYKSPFFFGDNFNFHNSFFMGLSRYDSPDEFRKIGEFVDKAGEAIQQMQRAIKMISLGIDYRKYVKFNYLTPNARLVHNGDVICEMHQSKLKDFYSEDELFFLVNFVIESALKLQEFEIDYDQLNFKKPEYTITKN
ncbi:MAG TPA: hypothetical protein VIK29_08175 [Paludibacter sp.]